MDEEENQKSLNNKNLGGAEGLDELDLFLQELIPAVLGESAKTDIRELSESDFNEVIRFLSGMLSVDYTG